MTPTAHTLPPNFIRKLIAEDIKAHKFEGRVHTRFPPEPNGYLHIGHIKAICINFGLAQEFGGQCNLRFDDTNPVKEDTKFVEAIKEDVRWLGFAWNGSELYASDYFDQLYAWAIQLIKSGQAYVDSLSPDQIRDYRGTLTEPGQNSPYRDRLAEENLDLFERMKNGEFAEGEHCLRAKIDMASPNLNLRDPVIYRILHAHHHRTGDKWHIYPMYDYAQCTSDSIEGVTHSLCSIEFENNRPLYNWYLETLGIYHPEQTEFARLSVAYTMTSKRRLIQLVTEGHVSGWDDPRMPTVSGMRRLGYTAAALRNFVERTGIAKKDSSVVDYSLLEHCVREDLNHVALRVMAVIDPLKMVILNYPQGQVEELAGENNPQDPAAGSRMIPFSREIYIERADFREDAPRKYFRLKPGQEVRLKHAYYITCVDMIKDETTGAVVEVHCTYDPETRGGWSNDGRKVKGTLHWVSAAQALEAEVRLYERLFTKPDPTKIEAGGDFIDNINTDSLSVVSAKVEPSLAEAKPGRHYQFLRNGYFVVDPDTSEDHLVFNRTVTLRDKWAKIEKSLKK